MPVKSSKSIKRKSTIKTKTETKSAKPKPSSGKRWVKHVADTSDAMDLKKDFSKGSPKQIAASLKRSVMKSHRTKGTKFQSAMSMLNFFINRGGKGLSADEKDRLERAKPELRKIFGKEEETKKPKAKVKVKTKMKTKTTVKTKAKRQRENWDDLMPM